jgi:hypothetical protein
VVIAAGGLLGDVVDVAPARGGLAAGEPAALVAGGDGPSGGEGDLGGVALGGEQVDAVADDDLEGGVAGQPVDGAAHDAGWAGRDGGGDGAGDLVGDPVGIDEHGEGHRCSGGRVMVVGEDAHECVGELAGP